MEGPSIPTGNGYLRSDSESLNLSDVVRTLRRQRKWILATLGAVLCVTIVYTLVRPPVYRARATLRVAEEQASSVPMLAILSELSRGATVETEMEILRSRRVAEGVVQQLGLQADLIGVGRGRRDEVVAELRVDPEAIESNYRIRWERDRFLLSGPEGETSAPYNELARLGPITVAVQPPASGAVRDEITLVVSSFAGAVAHHQERLQVLRPQREASIVAVGYESTDPVLARNVVNAALRHFLGLRNEMQKQQASAAVSFLKEQVRSLEDQLAEAEEALERFRQRNLVVQAEAQVSEDVQRLAELQARRSELEVERTTLARLLGDLEGPDRPPRSWAELASFPTFLKNDAISQILQQLTRLETELSRLLSRRTPEDPDVQNLQVTIRHLEDRLSVLAESYLRALDEQSASLDAALARFDAELQRVPAVEVQYARLKRNTDVLGELYTFLQTRLKEAEVSEAVEVASIQVVDPAVVPVEPVKPRKMLNLILGALLGGTLAVGIAFARESLDTRLRSRDELIELTGLPVLATVPRIATGNGRQRDVAARIEARLVTHHSPRSAAAEAYRTLRTNLTFAATGRGRSIQRLLFTSAEPEDGKSTTAANAAITLAEQGHRTLLVECDLRRPVLDRVFGVARTPGLVELLVGEAHLAEVARRVSLPEHVGGSLDLIPAGASPPNPAELLGSAVMREFLDRAAERYDRIVLDTPPLGVVTDGAVVGTLADGVVIVTRHGVTHREALRLACEELRGVNVNVVGTVLNDLDQLEDGYGYSYAYRGYYGDDEA